MIKRLLPDRNKDADISIAISGGQQNHSILYRKATLLLVPALIIALICLFFSKTTSLFAENDPGPNDSTKTAEFFGIISASPAPNLTPPPEWETGMTHEFRVLDVMSGELQHCHAHIFLITDNIVFWIDNQDAHQITQSVTERLKTFDSETLPMLRETFGEENNPGIDNDARFHVLFTGRIGINYNGYFSAEDQADPRIRHSSNSMDLVLLNSMLLTQGANAVIDTLSHEYQHLIHFHYDQNEQSVINEGLSGLAEYLALGRIRDTFIRNFLSDTGKSLIWWPDSGSSQPYYGSSFLFSMYLYERFGADFIRELVSCPENGLNGLDKALQNSGIPYSADDIFQQWTAALLGKLMLRPVREWDYQTYPFPQDGIYRDIKTLSCGKAETHEIPQYGLRFYNSNCPWSFSITVNGQEQSSYTSLPIPSGKSAWWSGAENNSMAVLSRSFDLSGTTDPVKLEYDTVYDIEKGYDHYYLLLTDEEGRVNLLSPSSATSEDPAGQNLGSGTTGKSNGVIHEAIALDKWAGQNVTISFVYLTDTAGLGDGLLLDNISINAIGFTDDEETDSGSWHTEGFRMITEGTEQQFFLTVLHPQNDATCTAEFLSFSGGQPVTVNCPEGGCAFAVSAGNRNLRSRTSFTVETDTLKIRIN